MNKLLSWLFPKTMEAHYRQGFEAGRIDAHLADLSKTLADGWADGFDSAMGIIEDTGGVILEEQAARLFQQVYARGVRDAGGDSIEMGEVLKSTLADPIRIGWAYKKALDQFGRFVPNLFYDACGKAARRPPEELKA